MLGAHFLPVETQLVCMHLKHMRTVVLHGLVHFDEYTCQA